MRGIKMLEEEATGNVGDIYTQIKDTFGIDFVPNMPLPRGCVASSRPFAARLLPGSSSSSASRRRARRSTRQSALSGSQSQHA
jgi:hypothetical protein